MYPSPHWKQEAEKGQSHNRAGISLPLLKSKVNVRETPKQCTRRTAFQSSGELQGQHRDASEVLVRCQQPCLKTCPGVCSVPVCSTLVPAVPGTLYKGHGKSFPSASHPQQEGV